MKRTVNIILVLMTLCVGCIIGLQSFWNYQNYQSTVATFQHDINESLSRAVDLEMDQRHQQLLNRVKGWLADTSFITITCDTKNRDSNTVFYIKDRHPKYAGDRGHSFGLADFTLKLNRITPEAKRLVINRFADGPIRRDLQKGFIYYYTQRLGDSLKTAFDNSRVRLSTLDSIYQQQLMARDIHTTFRLNPADTTSTAYLTRPVNTAFQRPYKKVWVRASFESPDRYFLKTMKWVIGTTVLLITICLLCFGYTARTLLSQHKLAELKDDFINNMTHELNTPLASIRITAEALKVFDHTTERRMDYLDIISYQTEKLTDLTAKILTTNRLMVADRADWHPVDLNRLLEKAIQELSVRIDSQQATIAFHPGTTPLLVHGQTGSLLTAFTNIIDNALKYAAPHPRLDIRIVTKSKWVAIAFADNGIGIPAEYQTKIFEPFFRVPQGNVHDVKGYGLGLNYVRQVLIKHRGFITVQANQPCGSLFSVNLPLV